MGITDTVTGTIEVAKGLRDIESSNLSFSKEALQVLQVVVGVGDSITPFIPLIGAAATIISELVKIYHTAQYNKKICNSLLDRARLAEVAIDQLIRRRKENERNFKNKMWYKAFDRFVMVLNKMKVYAETVSQLKGITACFRARSIEERFNEITIEYDNVMKDLNFTMAIANEQQRQIDHESVKQDLVITKEFLEKIDEKIEEHSLKLALISEEVRNINSNIEKPDYGDYGEAKRIDQSELTEPEVGRKGDSRGSGKQLLKRKIYMNAIEVACKPINIPEKESKEYKHFHRQLIISVKVTQSPNVIQFYGLSNVDDRSVMVLEWAQLGSLKNYYEINRGNIPLKLKLNFALHICRGIAYLNALDIYHRDLRCKNVMVTGDNVAKLGNFESSRRLKDFSTISLSDRIEMSHWSAPEKLKDLKYEYDHRCEIFSFGMLLWELAFERKPYEGEDFLKITERVIKGEREKIQFNPAPPEIDNIQKGFEKVITGAWDQDPDVRISISKLLIDIDTLVNSFAKPPQVIVINRDEEIPEQYDNLDFDSIEDESEPPFISVSDGIKAHKEKDYDRAWKCFEMQAENNNSLGKYWKAYYLWEGYAGKKDKATALDLYKEAADDGLVDAQFRYARALLDKDVKLRYKVNPKDSVKYLKLAADNGSGAAQFQMGEAYFKGRLGCQQSLEMAVLWYKRAVLHNEEKAKVRLNELNLDK